MPAGAANSLRWRDAALLGALFAAQGARVAQSELARAAGIAPHELGSALAPYLAAGYPIEFHPHGGIELKEPPDIWCAEEILGRCPRAGKPPGVGTRFCSPRPPRPATWSAPRRAKMPVKVSSWPPRTRLRAGVGSAARGSRPPDCGLYVSNPAPARAGGRRVGPPDDFEQRGRGRRSRGGLELAPRKSSGRTISSCVDGNSAGSLIEAEPRGAKLDFAVIGIGINVRHRTEDFSPDVRSLATSVFPRHGPCDSSRRSARGITPRIGAAARPALRRSPRRLGGEQPDARAAGFADHVAGAASRPGAGPG